MLYVTTRDPRDAYTANRSLTENRCPEGGFFVPMRLPYFTAQQIAQLAKKSFSQNVADILNLFFGTRLDGWAIEFQIGRYPVKMVTQNGRITVAELWHNPAYRFDRLIRSAESAVRGAVPAGDQPSDWLKIATRIAVLFGIFGLLGDNGKPEESQKVDIALPAGDLSALMAAWYARAMGLPIGTIICCSNENDSLWNLFHKGEFRTGAVAPHTHTPGCDHTVPKGLERLIFAVLGRDETKRYCEICRTGGTYQLDSDQAAQLRDGIHSSVISDKRMASTILNLYHSTGYIADPYTSLSYCGLLDYRAVTGESCMALILAEDSPVYSAQFMAECMRITPAELKILLA